MQIAITGASGMIGSKLTAYLMSRGHQVTAIARGGASHGPQASDVVINLAGANIAGRWSPEYKREILESRVLSTRSLCGHLSQAERKPGLFISASAVGFYGSHSPEKVLDENSPLGAGFLADVCDQWEKETNILVQTGIRVVRMRLGVVLSKTGGALAQMMLPFQLGIGGRLGSGRQMMSWVALDEIPYVVDHLIKNDQIRGAVNVVSPQAVSNARFTEILGQVMHRPTVLPVPGFAIRLLFGEMGQQLLLEGANVVPRRLQESGYQFRSADLKETLKLCLI